MFEALSDRFDGIFRRLRGKGQPHRGRRRRGRCARSASPCSRPTSTSRSSRTSSPASASAPSAPELSEALNPAPAGHQDRPRGAHRHPRRRDASASPTPRSRPTVVLMAGLQGSGKTTNSAKLARWFKSQGRNPLLVGADLQRPAAVEQLRTLGRQIDVPGLLRGRPTRWHGGARPAHRRGPHDSAATSSSSTPPAASPSTPS